MSEPLGPFEQVGAVGWILAADRSRKCRQPCPLSSDVRTPPVAQPRLAEGRHARPPRRYDNVRMAVAPSAANRDR
jgi:hypothetical protein